MNKEKKNKIKECIEKMCSNEQVGVNFDEIKITFSISKRNILRNYILLSNCVEISNESGDICYFVCGDLDVETICECALSGYKEEKDRFLKREKEEQILEKRKKEHPILSIFKR